MDFFDPPIIRLVAIPFFATGIFAGLIRWIGGPEAGARLSGASIGVVFLWLAAMTNGLPGFPPGFNGDAMVYILMAGLVVGVLLDLYSSAETFFGKTLQMATIVVFGAVLCVWMAGGIGTVSIIVYAVWLMFSFRLWRQHEAPGIATVILMMGAIALVGLAYINGSTAEWNLAVGLAAGLAGTLVWSWGARNDMVAMSAILTAGGALAAIASRLADTEPTVVAALILLCFIPFADSVAARVIRHEFLLSRMFKPLTVAGLSLLPVLLSAAIFLVLTQVPTE